MTSTTPDYMNAITTHYAFAVEIAKLMFGATRRIGSANLTFTQYMTRDGDTVVIQSIDTDDGRLAWKVGFFDMDMTQTFPTDAAPVAEQPAPTFDDLRAATDAASAAELAAHNTLVQAENAYCYAAGLDGDDRREWAKIAARFGRTKAGQQLHAALAEARKTLREAVRVDTEACRKTWVNGFGTLQPVTEAPTVTPDTAQVDLSDLALDPIDYDWSNGYQDAINGKPRQWVASAQYANGYDAGTIDDDALATATDLTIEQEERRRIVEDALTPDKRPDIVSRLTEAALSLNSARPTQTERAVIAALIDATDAIMQLRENLARAYLKELQTSNADEITRLNAVITGLQVDLHSCENAKRATEGAWAGNDEAARAEIEQLRGELFAERNAHAETTKALREILGGDPVAEVKYDADYSMPWVCIVRKMEQSAKFYCSSREDAEKQAVQTAAALRHKNKWTSGR